MHVLLNLAQTYTTYYSDPSLNSSTSSLPAGFWLVLLVILVPLIIFSIICQWRIFTKAGKPGWAAIVPIYNTIVLLEVVGRPIWWIIFFFLSIIPFVGAIATIVVLIIVMNDLSKSFGKSTGFTVLLILLPIIAYPILAFGKDQYLGPAGAKGGTGSTPPTGTGMGMPPQAPQPPMPQGPSQV